MKNQLALDTNGSILVAPINLLCATFCERVILEMSDKELENAGSLYAYEAYVENLLNYVSDNKNSHLQLGMYYQDASGKFNVLTGQAMVKGATPFCKNKGVELLAPELLAIYSSRKDI